MQKSIYILSYHRKSSSFGLSIFGAIFGGLATSFGHIRIVVELERWFCPPLTPIGIMGQYGMIFFVLGLWGILLGAFTGALTAMRSSSWIAIYFVIVLALATLYRDVLIGYGLKSTFTIALIMVIVALPLPNFGILCFENWLFKEDSPKRPSDK